MHELKYCISNYEEVLIYFKSRTNCADGNAYKLANLDKKLTDSIYKTEPIADRIAMNNAIITNTMNSAITNNSILKGDGGSKFYTEHLGSNHFEGQKSWNLKMMQYYKGIKDTTEYLKLTSIFYDQYYMRLTVNSVRKPAFIKLSNRMNE
ncbi:MAG: hypothetical protein U5L72_03440 [Bacteroidales bacterium]|nr:hypothetical protein [Bacteroidales bacterium]